MTEGCFAVILDSMTDRVLLVRRRDVPFWDLPGGRREEGEDVGDCAVREVWEETGLDVRLERKVGEYYRPRMDDLQHVFRAHVLGGIEVSCGSENSRLGWFSPDRLPFLMVPHRRRQIKDCLDGCDSITRVVKDPAIMLAIGRLFHR